MSQDVYLGRKIVDARVLAALEAANPLAFPAENDDLSDESGARRDGR
jgi:hypothetical protein